MPQLSKQGKAVLLSILSRPVCCCDRFSLFNLLSAVRYELIDVCPQATTFGLADIADLYDIS